MPSLKVASYLERARGFIKARPNISELDLDIGLRKMWQETDAQFGQMIYSTLFWNNYVKQIGQASLLSLGWQYGFTKTFGGAGLDLVKRGV